MLEAAEVGAGASGRNGGFLFGGYSLAPERLIRQVGKAQARRLYQLTTDAVALVRQRVTDHAIRCDLNPAGVLLADWFDDQAALIRQQRLMNEVLGCNWQLLSPEQLGESLVSQRYGGGLLEPDAAHLHPLNYCLGLARVLTGEGIAVHTRSPAQEIERHRGQWRVRTPEGEVVADTVVIATGGYTGDLGVPSNRAILPIATYIAVTEPMEDLLDRHIRTGRAVYDTRFAFDYYRRLPDNRLLWGGRISARNREPAGLDAMLRRDLARVFPDLAQVAFEYRWQGLMGYPVHQMPMIGQSEPGLWHVTGFGGHGVAPTTALGELCAAALAEGDDRFRWFEPWPLQRAWGRPGRAAAQLNYWWLQFRDAVRAARKSSS